MATKWHDLRKWTLVLLDRFCLFTDKMYLLMHIYIENFNVCVLSVHTEWPHFHTPLQTPTFGGQSIHLLAKLNITVYKSQRWIQTAP